MQTAMLETVHGKEQHPVVSPAEWLAARPRHLAREKEFTRLRDELGRERRELPWERVDKPYSFDGLRGKQTLADLFDGRSQLMVYHFMLGPDWQEGCHGCSFVSDHIDPMLPHLEHHDVSVMAISRAPLAAINAYKKRMGWQFKWLSSLESDFNFDYYVSFTDQQRVDGKMFYNYRPTGKCGDERPGISVFYRDGAGQVYHTYSSYERGLDLLLGTYNYLDLTPKGRNEMAPLDWMRRHDQYQDVPQPAQGAVECG